MLARMVDGCQRCDAAAVCDEWLGRASGQTAEQTFCPNADVSKPAKV